MLFNFIINGLKVPDPVSLEIPFFKSLNYFIANGLVIFDNINLIHFLPHFGLSAYIKLMSIPNKCCPFDTGIPSDVHITHTIFIKFKCMLQTRIIFGVLGLAPMIFTLLFGQGDSLLLAFNDSLTLTFSLVLI
uniref:Uncharacterized protein n=1 Tax=Lacticaseibacillus paracasei subsp. paracasei TaxID=47714 RepID=Q3ZR59_LACPA|nr:hypothetical protein [Lacticaseibacillus paracasei subsp. paracasei]